MDLDGLLTGKILHGRQRNINGHGDDGNGDGNVAVGGRVKVLHPAARLRAAPQQFDQFRQFFSHIRFEPKKLLLRGNMTHKK